MKIVLISGLSGSGKTIVLNLLEDLGYYCVDNLPLELLPELARLHGLRRDMPLAVSIDIRSGINIQAASEQIEALRAEGNSVEILFLEADDDILMRRFSETRRSHPLLAQEAMPLSEGLAREREWLMPLRDLAYCINTSHLSAQALRQRVQQWLDVKREGLLLTIESFGFKHGNLAHANFLFDVRSLPNPYYDPKLRPFTGLDQPIRDYFSEQPLVWRMIDDIERFLMFWLPQIEQENRSYATVGIGCTGGQHRSVFISETVAQRLNSRFQVLLVHRQLAQ